jgi:DNA-binding GntR family transcriptional regulator
VNTDRTPTPSVDGPTESRVPAPYEVIVEHFRERIAGGELQPGDHLPTVREIAESWSVARGTANKAITALQNAGLVSTGGRAGTVVADTAESDTITIAVGHSPNVTVLSADVDRASDVVAQELGIEPGSTVIVVQLKTNKS